MPSHDDDAILAAFDARRAEALGCRATLLETLHWEGQAAFDALLANETSRLTAEIAAEAIDLDIVGDIEAKYLSYILELMNG